MSTRVNSRYSSGIQVDLEKLYTLRDLFGRYGPVARLLLEDFSTEKPESELDVATREYDAVVDDELVSLLRTGASFQYNLFNQGDSHTILLLDLYFPGVSAYKNIPMVFRRRIVSPMIGFDSASSQLMKPRLRVEIYTTVCFKIPILLAQQDGSLKAVGMAFSARVEASAARFQLQKTS